jgi:ribosomal protein L11 methyltransferase
MSRRSRPSALPPTPAQPSNQLWRFLARVRGAEAAGAVFSVLDEIAEAVSAFETALEEWRLEAYPQLPALTPALAARLSLAAVAAGGVLVKIEEEKLASRDWLAENQLAFPPLRVARFFICGSHYRGPFPAGTIGIVVDAATAFGTGEHPSTRACLMALDRLATRHRFHRSLDIGTGTGILSIAAAKLLRRRVMASDIDRGAADVARHNVVRNGVRRLVQVRTAPGYRDRALHKSRYDLILSNILARPLAELARDLAGALAPGGRAVLSGLLRRQEPMVLAAHRGCGIVLEQRVVIDGWSTLILRGRPRVRDEDGGRGPHLGIRFRRRFVRLPSAARISRDSERRSAASPARACGHLLQGRRFANSEFRYRQANDRRAPPTRHKPVPGVASRTPPSWPK